MEGIASLRLVSKKWNKVIDNQDMWQTSFKKLYPNASSVSMKRYTSGIQFYNIKIFILL